jgi:hypothetical protein
LVAVVAGVVGGAVSYLGAYLGTKGQNLATKEDVGEITKKVEEIRTVYAERLEDHSQANRLRLAALDRRLEAHQTAYAKWWKLFHSVHGNEAGKNVEECQNWLVQNSLYLTVEVREAFRDAYHAAHIHSGLLRARGAESELRDRVYENWEKIERCGELILRSAGLPGFSQSEAEEVKKLAFQSDEREGEG